MQAVRIHEHGPPSVLRIEDLPMPTARRDEVLVRVLGVSLNHLDLWVRRGIPGVRFPLPLIPGCDGTGEIVALGEAVTDIKLGTRVVIEPGYTSGTSKHDLAGEDHLSDDYAIRGEHKDGFDAEYVAIERRLVTPLPDGVDPRTAAAVPLVFVTAWGMLVERAKVAAGESVLVLAGSGGVGSAAIQIAKDKGALVVATAGSDEKRALCTQLGADHVVDHGRDDWSKTAKELTGGRGFDVVVEHVGPATWEGSMRVLARNGRLVTCGGTSGAKVSILLPHLFMKNLSVLGSTMGPRSAYRAIFDKVAAGVYRPVVDRVMPLSKVAEAHELLEAGKVRGKIVLVPGE